LTKEQKFKDKDNSNKIGKALEKLFMAQRAKGRMALDHWNAWLQNMKSKD